MAPDLNSLPPSRSISSSPLHSRTMQNSPPVPNRQETPSPRVGSTSLAAAATMNAADLSQRSSSNTPSRSSPRFRRMSSDRTRSQIAISLNQNDPTLPSPGELSSNDRRSSITFHSPAASSHSLVGRGSTASGIASHHRQPSLGDIHNELEQEGEATVNRMLHMIRVQQNHLEALQRAQGQDSQNALESTGTTDSTAIVDEPTPASERSFSLPRASLSRQPSSANRSPALRALPTHDDHGPSADFWPPPSPLDVGRRNSMRDESAFYQAETANLKRENQMLKIRIRELEKQVNETHGRSANVPALPSHLATTPPFDT